MIVVWVVLPVGITVGHDIDAVSCSLNTGFPVLEMEFAKSGQEVLARIPG